MSVSEKMIEAAARADAEFAGRTFDGLSGHEKTRYRERAALMLAAAMGNPVVTDEMVESAMVAAEVPEEERAGVGQYFERIIHAALTTPLKEPTHG